MTLRRRPSSEMKPWQSSLLRKNTTDSLIWVFLVAVCSSSLLITPTCGFTSTRCCNHNHRVHALDIRIFGNNPHDRPSLSSLHTRLHDHTNNQNEDCVAEEEEEEDEEPLLVGDIRGRPAGVVLEDLEWRVAKLRLEEANTKRFLKAGPRFLPYEECRKWVQAWGNRWQSAQEWENWIAAGEKRNSYIPSRPEEYFSRRGEWISWDHFLGVDSSNDSESNT